MNVRTITYWTVVVVAGAAAAVAVSIWLAAAIGVAAAVVDERSPVGRWLRSARPAR